MSNSLSKWEFAILIGKGISSFPSKLFLNLLRNYVICWQRGLPTGPYLSIGVIRTLLTTFSPREIGGVVPGTRNVYRQWLSKQKQSLQPRSWVLPSSRGALHWIGINPHHVDGDSKLILFFHGGGYAVPLSSAHLDWCWKHVDEGGRRGLNLGVAVLEYSLYPGASYPTQLQQAAEALKFVVDTGFRPQNVIVGGDSAGGNLTFALLCHLITPNPAVIPIQLNGRLGGAFGISPWLTMMTNTQSFYQNASIDMLSPSLIQQSGNDFLQNLPQECERTIDICWSMPLESSPSCWTTLETVTRSVFLNTGQHEMMRDHVLAFGQLLSQKAGKTLHITVDVGKNEAHDHILVDFMRQNREGRTFIVLMQWMYEVFTTSARL